MAPVKTTGARRQKIENKNSVLNTLDGTSSGAIAEQESDFQTNLLAEATSTQ